MKKILLTISLICISTLAFSQTNISGYINSYTQVLSFNSNACLAEMTVDDATEFSPGDTAIIIQMKGATADQTNTSAFGDLIAPNGAGIYEKCIIDTVIGNVISLDFQLVNIYDVSALVQLVRVPHYPGNVTVTGVLTALPWDGTTGGVLAFTCAGTVTLNANIDMSGLGFSGGVDLKLGITSPHISSGASCFPTIFQSCVGSDYFYAAPSLYAVEKGEGLVMNTTGFEVGKGKLVNAGGGGGMSYGGGGGGSNYGAGGAAGGCNDNACSDLLCAPCNEALTAGIGGANLAAQYNNVQNRIFLGGGGGSGHHGNSDQNDGPNGEVEYFNVPHRNGTPGGGIVIIDANQIVGNGNTISAAGADGTNAPFGQTGGTGGGGAGGSVVLSTASAIASLNVDVSGGRGNDAYINGTSGTTAGAGGGGGGGVYWSSVVSAGVTLDASAGLPGISTDNNGVVGVVWQGSAGSNGGSLSGLAIPEGSVPAGAGTVLFADTPEDTMDLCEGNSYPVVLGAPAGQTYQWQIDSTGDGSGPYINLANGPGYNNVDSFDGFLILNVDTGMHGFYYRMIVYNACDSFISDSMFLSVSPNPVVTTHPQSQTSCAGGNALFYVEAQYGVTYQWQQILPVFANLVDDATFSGTNTDSLVLTNIPASLNGALFRVRVTNMCNSTFSNPAFLNFASTPITIDSISSDVEVCEGNDSLMYVAYTGNVDSIRWQVDTGTGFVDLSNDAFHQGVDQDTLLLNNIPISSNGNTYRVILSNDCSTTATSGPINLTVSALSITVNSVVGCEGQSLSITATPTGTNVTFQWQIDTSGVWENLTNDGIYSNTNAAFLLIDGSIVDTSLNSNDYRVLIDTDCGADTSVAIQATITPSPAFTLQPVNDTVCPGDTAMFTVAVSNAAGFQWQSNEFGPFSNLANGATYTGVDSPTLNIINVTPGLDGVVYRIRIQGNSPCGMTASTNAQLFIGGDAVSITDESEDLRFCPRIDSFIYASYTGSADSIFWEVDAGLGFTFNNAGGLSGLNGSDTLEFIDMDPSLDGNIYRAIILNACGESDTSENILLSQYGNVNIITSPNETVCEGDTAMFYFTATGPVASTQWQISNGALFVDIVPSATYQISSTGDTLIITPTTLAMDGDVFNIMVTDSCGNEIDGNVMNLAVNPNSFSVDSVVLCSTDSLVLSDGTVITTAGTYLDTIATGTSNGCDSIIQYDLSFFPQVSSNDTQVICFGDSFMLSDGSFVNSTGVYNDTLTGAAGNGCDSVNIIDLTVSPQVTSNDTQVLCFGDSLMLSDGSFVNATGIYNDTLTGAAGNGCDSVNIIDLTVSPQITGNDTQVICFGDSFMLSDGSFVNATGTYNDTLTGAAGNGCDSVNIVDLTVSPQITGNDTQVICFGDSFMLSDGSFVNATGLYNDTLTGAAGNGCDSVNIVDLTVSPQITGNDTQVICFGDSFMLSDGSFVNATGTYNDTLTGAAGNGCDSVNIVDLTVSPQITGNDTQVICFGDSFMLSNGSFVNATGTYNDTLTGAAGNGCDSVNIVDLTVSPQITGNDTQVICFGDSFMLSDGSFVNATGTYNDTLTGAAGNGCDSVNIVDLTVSPQITGNDTQVICFGDSFMLSDGSFVNATGTYNDTLTGAAGNGCDSVNIVDLTVSPQITGNDTQVICFGDSFMLSDGSFVNATGTYNDTLTGAAGNGCDSVNIIDLTVSPQITGNDTQVICFGDSFMLSDGSFVNATGIYNDTLTGAAGNGCDSVNIVDLTVSPQITGNDTQVICFGDSFMLSDGSFVNATGIYNDTLTGAAGNGCDSVSIVDLTVSPQITGNDTQVICFGDSFMLSDGSFVNATGTYNDTLTGAAGNGCDSVNIIDLTVSPQVTSNDTQVLCFGDSLMLSDGSFVNATGVYNDTIAGGASSGCDSLNIVDLTISPLVTSNDTQVLCFGDSLMLSDGSFVNATGIYNDTLAGGASTGCDSINIINLTISPLVTSNDTQVLCFGDSLMLSDGSFVNATGTYNDTLVAGSSNGCDSINIIDLTISPQITGNDTQVLCFGDSLMLSDGSFVNATGTYNDTIVGGASNACDSVNIIDLTISPQITGNDTQVLCFGDSFMLSDGSFVNSTGTYNDTITGGAGNGCDSVNIIDLIISPLPTANDTQVLCFGDSLMLSDGSFVNITGMYNDTITGGAGNGCDSVNIIDLTISPLLMGVDTQVICSGDSFQLMNGLFVDTTGTYNDTVVGGGSTGCDTIIQVDLTVLPNPTSAVVDSFCAGGDYILASGLVVDTAGIFNDTLVAAGSNGCDSIIVYDLSIIAAFVPSPPVFDTICFNQTYTLPSGIIVDTAGVYNDTLSTATGCDSIYVVDLFVRPANSIIQQSGNLLLCIGDTAAFYVESADSNVTYQWEINGVDVVSGTNDTLIIPNVNASNGGDVVQVRVMGICDTLFSNAALLSVRQIGVVATDPADITVCAGDSAGFSVTTNIPVVSFEWFENGVAIAGSNNASYSIPVTTLAQDSNVYFCAVTDSCGFVDSSAIATLRVNPNAQISLQSIDLTVCAQDSALFFVTASGTNVTYQWLENGAALPGETNDSLSLNPVTPNMDSNIYACEVSSDCGDLVTNDMVLTVNDTSTFIDQSVDIVQCEGFSFDLFIDATNIVTYQWQIDQGAGFVNLVDGPLGVNGTDVSGATTANLTVSNYDLTISGAQYQVITTVNCGTAPIFTPVTVTITSPVLITDRLEDTVVCLADVAPISVPYVDGAALWNNGDFGQFFEPTFTGDYIVEFTDSNSCPQSDTIFVQVDDCVALCVVTAPTGFSPNGSGANDIFRAIYTCDLSFYELQVYNRWGELVYMTNEPLEGWDGVFKGVNAEIGTYTWYISYQKEGADRKEDVKGNVTLIR